MLHEDHGLGEVGEGEDVRGGHVLVAGVEGAGHGTAGHVDGDKLPPPGLAYVGRRW